MIVYSFEAKHQEKDGKIRGRFSVSFRLKVVLIHIYRLDHFE